MTGKFSNSSMFFNSLSHDKNVDLSNLKAVAQFALIINPFPNDKFLALPKSLQMTTLNLMKLAEFSRRVENTVGKGEIACYEQFLLFPQHFQDMFARNVKTRVCFGKG